jgi:WD40 repeat protein
MTKRKLEEVDLNQPAPAKPGPDPTKEASFGPSILIKHGPPCLPSFTPAVDLAHRLTKLTLRRIVKMNHETMPVRLSFNTAFTADLDHRNCVAVLGGDQVALFDNEHIGDHLDIYVHYKNEKTEYVQGGGLAAVAWLRGFGDAYVAVAGAEGIVQVMSVGHTRVVKILRGHAGPVGDLAQHPTADNMVVSCSEADGTVRVWDWFAEECVAVFKIAGPTALAVDAVGQRLAVGTRTGQVAIVPLAPVLAHLEARKVGDAAMPASDLAVFAREVTRCDALRFVGSPASPAVNLPEAEKKSTGRDVLAARFGSGAIVCWDIPKAERVLEYAVDLAVGSPCGMDVTPDGTFLVSGNNCGQVFVWSLGADLAAAYAAGPRPAGRLPPKPRPTTTLKHPRAKSAVTDVVFTPRAADSILVATGDVLWRWDYRENAPAADDTGKIAGDGDGGDDDEE